MTRRRSVPPLTSVQLHTELSAWCNDRLDPDDYAPMALAMLHVATSLLCLDLGDDTEAVNFIKRSLDRRLEPSAEP